MKGRVYTIDGIDVLFVKSKRAKGVNISIRPFKGVKVSVPYFVTFKYALKITNQRIDWITKNLKKIKSSENGLTKFNLNTTFKTRNHFLKIIQIESKEIKYSICKNETIVYIPINYDINSELAQNEIRKAIEETWRKEAKEILPNRINYLAKKHGLNYQNIRIKNTKSRWGSCSYKNNINLSLHLMRLPDYLIDYVILHELVHTKIKNHSKDFWAMLEEVSFQSKKHDKELKNYRIGIY
ncbi:MAG: hypothetical protein CL846_00710 [Crocinitomicaceae bacterium]|nr:hypothetical protein [Crocinitomicaceae bacterium]|tara:strand:- start:211 stop:927 length:717 start_codon:yes stop_codon:yes gene_type:complete